MDKSKLTIDEKELLLEMVTSPALKPLLKVVDLVLEQHAAALVGGVLLSPEDEKRVLYTRSRYDGAEKLARDLKNYLNGMKAPKA